MNFAGYVGNIASDIELKQTTDSVSVLTLTIAVKRPHKKDVTDFIRAKFWRADAENVSRYFKKGDYIWVKGFTTTGSYTKKVGGEEVKIPTFELVVEGWGFCGSTKDSSNSQGAPAFSAPPTFEEVPVDDTLPF